MTKQSNGKTMDEQLKQKITRILLASKPAITLAYVFGSVAKNTAKPNSDIDIAILCPGITASQKMALWEQLAEAANRPLDWVDLNDAGSLITLEALNGERVIGDTTQHAQLLSRTLIDAEDYGIIYRNILKKRREAWLQSK